MLKLDITKDLSNLSNEELIEEIKLLREGVVRLDNLTKDYDEQIRCSTEMLMRMNLMVNKTEELLNYQAMKLEKRKLFPNKKTQKYKIVTVGKAK